MATETGDLSRRVLGRGDGWAPRGRWALCAPVTGTLVAPDLSAILLVGPGRVERASLAGAWAGGAGPLDVTAIPGLYGSSSSPCPFAWLDPLRLVHHAYDGTRVVDAATGATLARFPLEGVVSPSGALCAARVTSRSVERSPSADWRSDFTRDGDDLSERVVVTGQGYDVRFPVGHARERTPIRLPLGDAYAARWVGDEALVAWSNQAIDVCDLATRTPRRLASASWVISSVDVSPEGRFVVGEPPGKPVTLWRTGGEAPAAEIGELPRGGLLHVTDGGVVSSWSSETREVALWDARRGEAVAPLETTADSIAWAFDAAARRAVRVDRGAVVLFERG